ncbi:unnamed protein product [Microthlaspi erraticum]|uniref:EF-hand domain-containing protein n=1 Tax=Microthlaspi erraticum TaxID=1685480 RepID=A0A6D2HHV6_9BRAS|nr:unnamed protein product [Microthlaspi erraticum]
MQAADVDNSGTIDYKEFIAATLHLNKIEREDHLFAAFTYFDKDRSCWCLSQSRCLRCLSQPAKSFTSDEERPVHHRSPPLIKSPSFCKQNSKSHPKCYASYLSVAILTHAEL